LMRKNLPQPGRCGKSRFVPFLALNFLPLAGVLENQIKQEHEHDRHEICVVCDYIFYHVRCH